MQTLSDSIDHYAIRLFIFLNALDALTTGLVCYAIGPQSESNPLARIAFTTFGILGTITLKFALLQAVLVNSPRLGTTRLWILNILLLAIVLINLRQLAMVLYIIYLAG